MTGLEVWRVCDYVHVPHRNHVDGPCRNPRPLRRCVSCGCLVDAIPTQEPLQFLPPVACAESVMECPTQQKEPGVASTTPALADTPPRRQST